MLSIEQMWDLVRGVFSIGMFFGMVTAVYLIVRMGPMTHRTDYFSMERKIFLWFGAKVNGMRPSEDENSQENKTEIKSKKKRKNRWPFFKVWKDPRFFHSDGTRKEPKKKPNKKKSESAKIYQLTGFSPFGPPHRILGVRENATEIEIQTAFRQLMKRYHPDSVARPETDQWFEAQALAKSIIEAKEAMLKNRKAA